MDPQLFQPMLPVTRVGGFVEAGLPVGLYVRVSDHSKMIKAVPIIGEQKTPKPAPSLVGPKGESLAKPVVPTKDVRSSSQPKLFGPSGQQVHAEKTPSPFEGGLPKGPEPKHVIQPGAQSRSHAGLVTGPERGPSGPIVDPSGREVSSNITAGPGAARPKPTIHAPETVKPSGGELAIPSTGSTPRSSMTAGEAQWNAVIGAAKQREATASQHESEARPLNFKPQAQSGTLSPKPGKETVAAGSFEGMSPQQRQMMSSAGISEEKATPESGPLTKPQQKMMAAAGGGGGGEGGATEGEGASGGKDRGAKPSGSPPTRSPNILGNFGTGYQIGIQNDPAATVSLLGHRAAGYAHGLLSAPTPGEQARMQREAYQQRAEMLRQNTQQTQSAMQRSMAASSARPGMPPIRSGLRRS